MRGQRAEPAATSLFHAPAHRKRVFPTCLHLCESRAGEAHFLARSVNDSPQHAPKSNFVFVPPPAVATRNEPFSRRLAGTLNVPCRKRIGMILPARPRRGDNETICREPAAGSRPLRAPQTADRNDVSKSAARAPASPLVRCSRPSLKKIKIFLFQVPFINNNL